jgi:hypothetical protein
VRWYAVHHELATNAKWLRLSLEERGAWVTLLTIAAGGADRGSLRDRATAEALLRRDTGQTVDAARELVSTLIAAEWIDEDPDSGRLTFHDFDLWQLRVKKPSDWPEEIRRRVAEHRERKRIEQDKQDRTGQVTPRNASNALRPCPDCGADLGSKKGKRGEFLSCSRYPDCTYSEDLPPPPPKPFTPDYQSIREAHGGELPPGMESAA